jgi:hypothetical protein
MSSTSRDTEANSAGDPVPVRYRPNNGMHPVPAVTSKEVPKIVHSGLSRVQGCTRRHLSGNARNSE